MGGAGTSGGRDIRGRLAQGPALRQSPAGTWRAVGYVHSDMRGLRPGLGAVAIGLAVVGLDPASDRILATVPVDDQPDGLFIAAGSLWVATDSGETLERIAL